MDDAYAQVTYNISHNEALEVLLEAKSKAEADGVLVNIAVVDAGANLKAFIRMDQCNQHISPCMSTTQSYAPRERLLSLYNCMLLLSHALSLSRSGNC